MGLTATGLRDHILKHMTAEDALLRLLESSLLSYEKLKFEQGKEVHPLIIIANATMDLGWDFCIEKDRENIEGLVVGSEEYIKRIFKPKV